VGGGTLRTQHQRSFAKSRNAFSYYVRSATYYYAGPIALASTARRDVCVSTSASNGRADGGELVFGTTGQRGYNGWSDGKLPLKLRLPAMKPFVIHDLRRSVASGMAKLGINLPRSAALSQPPAPKRTSGLR
jgi:hypothetical protein